jgi:hypothetical protein
MTSTGTNIARRLWDQREELRAEYEDVHGTDRALWPAQHPGVVLDAVRSSAHGACLGCQWFDVRGHWMGHSDWFERACIWPHRHQVSNGVFLDGPRRWRADDGVTRRSRRDSMHTAIRLTPGSVGDSQTLDSAPVESVGSVFGSWKGEWGC